MRKLIRKIDAVISSPAPPDLVLKRHCGECGFQSRCRQKAIEEDDLSLLAGMTEKERRKFNSKGIFTVTQLSYTFRPRRRPRRLVAKREKYHHSLKALSIRDKKIHIVGRPELKIEGTPVFLDVEGLPDNNFYYLIGVRIEDDKDVMRHSLWADTCADEERIWNAFLDILSGIDSPVLIHFGSFETKFLKRMCDRYGGPSEGSAASKAIASSINLLSVIFAQVYFPSYSNGLKENARFLGFEWNDPSSSGLQSIVWRHQWEESRDPTVQEKVIVYNAEHAIKAFARLQKIVSGLSNKRGIDEYLTLLSVAETCEYQGLDFLDFLRSGEKDIHAFSETKRRRRRGNVKLTMCNK
ncbi:MAG: TM0106 family RecB-like putative nuclease [Nitrospirota bacterium]